MYAFVYLYFSFAVSCSHVYFFVIVVFDSYCLFVDFIGLVVFLRSSYVQLLCPSLVLFHSYFSVFYLLDYFMTFCEFILFRRIEAKTELRQRKCDDK